MIRYARTGCEDAIMCPHCSGEFMHHVGVDIYERHEDRDSGTHVAVYGVDTNDRDSHLNKASVVVDTSMDGNPSPRRQGLTIQLWCEGCQSQLELSVAQHKGQTLVNFDVVRTAQTQNDDSRWAELLAFLESRRKIALLAYYEFAQVLKWSDGVVHLGFNTKNDVERWVFENASDPRNLAEIENALNALGHCVEVVVTQNGDLF